MFDDPNSLIAHEHPHLVSNPSASDCYEKQDDARYHLVVVHRPNICVQYRSCLPSPTRTFAGFIMFLWWPGEYHQPVMATLALAGPV